MTAIGQLLLIGAFESERVREIVLRFVGDPILDQHHFQHWILLEFSSMLLQGIRCHTHKAVRKGGVCHLVQQEALEASNCDRDRERQVGDPDDKHFLAHPLMSILPA